MTSGAIDDPILSRSLTDTVAASALACFPHTWEEPRHGPARTLTAAVRRARTFIDEHAGEPITRTDVAAAAGLSLRHLDRVFQRHYEVTPTAYLRRARLELARDALLRADPADGAGVMLLGIAHASGFTEVRRFVEAYRAVFDEHPRQTLLR